MKRGLFFRILSSIAIVMLVVNVANSQQRDGNLSVTQADDQYVTVNKAMPYHVVPDPYFNPNYNVGGGWAVTSTFQWNFSTVPGGATPAFSSSTVINPDITLDVVGDYQLDIVESSPNPNSCLGTTTSLVIHVLDVPTTSFGGRADIVQCGALAATNVLFDIANNSADDFWVDWSLSIDTLTADQSLVLGNVSTTGHADSLFAAAGTGLTLKNQAFPVLGNRVTRYTFSLTGINDAVSRRSDYIAPLGRNLAATTFTNYAPGLGDDNFIIVVKPAPTTGNIYHIPNL